MTDFTPGPWSYEPGDLDDHYIMAGGLLAVTEGIEPKSEDEANARLIAAAPELLEGLVTARELVQTFLIAGDPDEHTRQRLEIIERVCNQGLARLEGRA